MYRFLFVNDTATAEIYTLSLHDALPISGRSASTRRTARAHSAAASASRVAAIESSGSESVGAGSCGIARWNGTASQTSRLDRKSTRLNSSHANISYAVFCLQKKH